MKPDEAVLIALPGGTEASFPPRDFDVLFADEHERLYRGLLFITGSRADAEELMQDAFLKLWERWTGSARSTILWPTSSGSP